MPQLRTLLCPLLLLACLVVPTPRVLHADDDPEAAKGKTEVPDTTPSPLAELKEEYLTRQTDPEDPVTYIKSFRDWLRDYEQPPSRKGGADQVYDVWAAAIRPRLPRMLRRTETMMKRKYWVPEEGTPERVKPESWSKFVREISALGTELHGAWKGYMKADIRDAGGQLSTSGSRSYLTFYGGWGMPYRVWHGHSMGRQGIHYGSAARERYSYWNLMRYYRRGWGWRSAHCRNCEARREELKERKEKVEEARAAVETTTATLAQQMLALRVLVGAMQVQEEHHIAEQIDALPRDSLLRKPAEELLDALRRARIEAERYDGDSSSRWGQLLRNWVRAYKAGMTLLEKEAKKLEEMEDDEEDEE